MVKLGRSQLLRGRS